MGDNEVVVDEKTWGNLNQESQSWIIYRTVLSQGERIDKLEKKHVVHKMFAMVGGFVGGAMSFLGMKYFQ